MSGTLPRRALPPDAPEVETQTQKFRRKKSRKKFEERCRKEFEERSRKEFEEKDDDLLFLQRFVFQRETAVRSRQFPPRERT